MTTPDGASRDQAGVPGTSPRQDAEGDADTARLRGLIRRLLTPARAGMYLGRDDLARLGAALGFAVPALDRRITLEHLLVAAGPAGLLPSVFGLLAQEAETWIATYREWEAACPHSAAVWAEWRGRAEAMHMELQVLRDDAAILLGGEGR